MTTTTSTPIGSRVRLACGAMLSLITICGCGAAAYEARLEETNKYFRYMEVLDQNLGPVWRDSGVELRAPRQFQLMPKPVPPKVEEGQPVPVLIDPRQPDYLNFEFPGLLGAWQTTVNANVNGTVAPRKAFIYVISNYSMFSQATQIEKAPQFSQNFLDRFWQILSIPEDQRRSSQEKYPKGVGYQPDKNFTVINLRPMQSIDGVQYLFDIYLIQQQDVQVAVVVATPADSDATNFLAKGVPLMLETMKLTGEKPRAGSQKSASTPAAF
ncbi:MAG: hypothetical protein C0478_13720 [Planctomyces sp.]|nr:hypothetical protein [Planctomyces sp.]